MRELTYFTVALMNVSLGLGYSIEGYCDEHGLDESKITKDSCSKMINAMEDANVGVAVSYDDLWEDLYRQETDKPFRGYSRKEEEDRIDRMNTYIEDHYEEVEFGGVRWMIKIK